MTVGNDTGPASFRYGIELTPDRSVDNLVELALEAERVGTGAIFASNHYHNRDPFVTLGAIGRATDTIALGPGVVNPYELHPARIATQVATLDDLTDGRAICGIGAGDESTLSALGLEQSAPIGTMSESVELLRKLFAGDRVTSDGHVSTANAGLNYGGRSIPLFVGAQGPQMLRLAAQKADGILVNAAHPAEYRFASEHIAAGLENSGDSDRAPTIVGFASVSVAQTGSSAKDAARAPVAFITASAPDRVLERHDIDLDRRQSITRALEGNNRNEAYDLVTESMLEAFAIVGTPDRVADQFQTLGKYTDAIVAASPLGPDRERAIEHLGSIMGRLRSPAAEPS